MSEPNTNVTLNGTVIPQGSFINNLYFEFSSTDVNTVSADKPIQLVQYSPTEGQTLSCSTTGSDVGDPEMIYLTPIEQGLNHVTLYQPAILLF